MVEFSKILKKVIKDDAAPQVKPVDGRAVSLPPKKSSEAELRQAHIEPDDVNEDVVRPVKALFTQRQAPSKPQAGPPAEISNEYKYLEEKSVAATEERKDMPLASVEDFFADKQASQSAFSIYDRMLVLAKQFFQKDAKFEEVDTKQIVGLMGEVCAYLSSGEEKLIELALTHIINDEKYYLFQHSINVCVISLAIGVEIKYELGRLLDLGIAAFLHDIGMVYYEEKIQIPRKLTQKEYEDIKNHVGAGEKILRRMGPGLDETIITAQHEIHERLDGSGYPAGKKVIHDYAKIIALADGFESMMHPRPYRPRYSIMEVFKRIFDAKNQYDQNLIKALVNKIGFFPNGCFVQLNTKEVGRVSKQNLKSPLRPIVRILYGPDGQVLDESEIKEVSLIKYPTIHIKKCFLEDIGKGEIDG